MDCLNKLIYINGYDTPVFPYSVKLQSLTGITLKNITASLNEDQRSAIDLINEKITFAQQQLLSDIHTELLPKFTYQTVIANEVVGKYIDNMPVVAASNQWQGIQYRLFEGNQNLEFFLNTISLYADTTVTTNIYVYNAITGKLLDTLPITTVAGEVTTITVNKNYVYNKQWVDLIFIYDGSVTGTWGSIPYLGNNFSGNSGCLPCQAVLENSGHDPFYSNPYGYFRGITLPKNTPFLNQNMGSMGNTAGLSISYSINCGLEAFLCSINNQLSMPMLYRVGAELLKEMRFSKRLNSIITLYDADHEKLEIEYETVYREKLQALLSNMTLPDTLCFQRRKKFKTVTQTP